MVEDRLHIGGGEAGDGDGISDEAGDDGREHDVDRAELAEQIGAARAVAGAGLRPELEDAQDLGA